MRESPLQFSDVAVAALESSYVQAGGSCRSAWMRGSPMRESLWRFSDVGVAD